MKYICPICNKPWMGLGACLHQGDNLIDYIHILQNENECQQQLLANIKEIIGTPQQTWHKGYQICKTIRKLLE